ncbi:MULTISPECIES: MBL fold metallo-hydrolase [unclassified Moraxella]|uniref:MBL fold metallo-hydrolase n=1 Tax=unclassified Moraxella TaxID=2685852 RepID=UPI003AF49B69
MNIHSFLDPDTETYTHVAVDESAEQNLAKNPSQNISKKCAIIDPVLDYDPKAGKTSTQAIDKVIDFIQSQNLTVEYIIETHAHADHLSSAPYVKAKLGGQIVIGKAISQVQQTFKQIFNLDEDFATDASQFDLLTEEGTTLQLGNITITAMHVAGHTPADMAYVFDDGEKQAVFVGDTIFAPDVGTARCDFPNGSAEDLYDSIQRLLALPDDTLLYLCHDYPPAGGRPHTPTACVSDQKLSNIHVKNGTSKAEFVRMRNERDKTLAMPRLILPSVQVNINAGQLPTAESNGVQYLKIPLNVL